MLEKIPKIANSIQNLVLIKNLIKLLLINFLLAKQVILQYHHQIVIHYLKLM